MRFNLALTLCLLAGLTSSVVADMVSYNVCIPITNVGEGMTVSLQKFNPSLGTLTGIQLLLDADASAGTITWDNESTAITTVDLGIGAKVTAIAPNTLTLIAIPLQTGSGSAAPDDETGAPDFAGDDSVTVTGGSGCDSDTANPDAADFGLYTGTDTFAVDISSILGTSVVTSGGSGTSSSQAGSYCGTVTVVYTYENVPEPATMGLLASGGVAMLIRRKRK